MRQFIKTLLLLVLLLPATATAHDFEVDGIYYNINGNEATVTYKGTNASEYSNEYTGAVTIPATVTYNGTTYSVTTIGRGAFYNCSDMTSVNIPNSVTSIGSEAFYSCISLTSVTIPNSVTSIGIKTFSWCSSLTSVTIPNSVTYIDGEAFYYCNSLTSITIPNSVTSIGYFAFSGCYSLTSINIPNSVTYIGDGAFWCCGMTSINIPNSVTYIGEQPFLGCSSLTSIQVENGNQTYDSRNNCNAIIETSTNTLIAGCMNTTIPNSVTDIGSYAFYGCSGLISITIPNSVTHIGNGAFHSCGNLKSITIPNSVTSFGYELGDLGWPFDYSCNSLTTVFLTGDGEWTTLGLPKVEKLYIDKFITGVKNMYEKPEDVFCFAVTPPTCDENSFLDYSGTLHVPAASLAAYFTAPYWCNFANIVGDAVKPNGLSLDKDSLELIIQEMTSLSASITPATASSGIINWVSSNLAVATIENGLVTAVGLGECDIIATFLDKMAVCHVTVYSDRISVDQQEAQLPPNHMVTLTPTSLAATLPALIVTSSDPTVAAARVMNGKVQIVGVGEGTATITVASADGTAKPATCLVTVYTEMGDTNGDGFIDIDDVTKLIERVLGNEANSIKEKNGDMNDDGILDIDDITALINTILGTT